MLKYYEDTKAECIPPSIQFLYLMRDSHVNFDTRRPLTWHWINWDNWRYRYNCRLILGFLWGFFCRELSAYQGTNSLHCGSALSIFHRWHWDIGGTHRRTHWWSTQLENPLIMGNNETRYTFWFSIILGPWEIINKLVHCLKKIETSWAI